MDQREHGVLVSYMRTFAAVQCTGVFKQGMVPAAPASAAAAAVTAAAAAGAESVVLAASGTSTGAVVFERTMALL